ncbi:MAG: GGDEF domain-containing protein [Armatimonadota bacterium]|nr:GGDEF domain-containing protein [Armatimonadota bacterium]
MSERAAITAETDRLTTSTVYLVCAAAISAAGAWSALRALVYADGHELLAFGALAFAAGLIKLGVGAGCAGVHLSAAVTLASVPFLGPAASVPAMLAALGEMASAGPDRERLSRALFGALRRSAAALVAGSAYALAVGNASGGSRPAAGNAFAVAIAAFALFDVAGRFLEERRKWDIRAGVLEYAAAGAIGWLIALWRPFWPVHVMVYTSLSIVGIHAASVALARTPEPVSAEPELVLTDSTPVEAEPERLSLVDRLTGLANDRYLYMFLQQEIGRSVRKNIPVSLILLDIDDFQSVNDQHGPEAADAAMVRIAALLKGCVREYDMIARYSSDEFAVVLPEAKLTDACDSAERIRAQIAEWNFAGDIRLQVSLGVATYPEHGLTPDNLISSAHHALNRAKFSGKNRVTSCDDVLGKLKYGT